MKGYSKIPHIGQDWSANELVLNVDDDGIEYQFKTEGSRDGLVLFRNEIDHPNIDYYEGYLSKEDLLRDTSSNKKILQPHAIIGVGFRLREKPRVHDFFRHTTDSKSTTAHVVSAILGIQSGFYFVRPWADTPITEWTCILPARKIIINDVEQDVSKQNICTINGNGLNDVYNMFMPSIDIKKNGSKISVQLLEPDGSQAKKKDVEVYLETTTGMLRENRLITDDNGYAETELMFFGKGKVKAGFKFYSGKSEVCFG
jgi:hypothetical protein